MNYWYLKGRWMSLARSEFSPMQVATDYYTNQRRVYFGRTTTLFDTYSKARSLAKREMRRDPDLDLRVVRARVMEPR